MRNANSGSPTRIALPDIDAVPPSAITVSLVMRPASGPASIDVLLPGLAGRRDLPAEQFALRLLIPARPGSRSLQRASADAVIPRACRSWCRRARCLTRVFDAAAISLVSMVPHPMMILFLVPAVAAIGASPIGSSRRSPRSARNCHAPDAETPRCRGRDMRGLVLWSISTMKKSPLKVDGVRLRRSPPCSGPSRIA